MRYWPTIILWIVAVALVFWIVGWSDAFQSCIDHNPNQTSEQASEKVVSIFLISRCTGEFIVANHEYITAISTLFIALFTLTLWTSTRQLWRAGQIHAERELRAYVVFVPKGIPLNMLHSYSPYSMAARRQLMQCGMRH
jgi:hypothetical protein